MPTARRRGTEYELVNFTDDAEYVLRDAAGDVLVVEDEQVEVRCDNCGRWSAHGILPAGDRWVCHDRACNPEIGDN